MIEHQFLAFNGKLLEQGFFVVPSLSVVVYLLDLVLFVAHLQMDLFQ